MATGLRPALAAFRRLMRAREMAFRGDTEMLMQSRLAVREEFLRHKARAIRVVLCRLSAFRSHEPRLHSVS